MLGGMFKKKPPKTTEVPPSDEVSIQHKPLVMCYQNKCAFQKRTWEIASECGFVSGQAVSK